MVKNALQNILSCTAVYIGLTNNEYCISLYSQGVFNNMNVQLHSACVYLHIITGMCMRECVHFHMPQCSNGMAYRKQT